MLIGAWLEGAETVLDFPVPVGQLAVAAAGEVERTIVSPRPGLFLDYALRSASLLSQVIRVSFMKALQSSPTTCGCCSLRRPQRPLTCISWWTAEARACTSA